MYHSSHSYKSWTTQPVSSSQGYPSSSPGPMPTAPHLRTVSLPHPNSNNPHHGSSSQYHSSQYGQGHSGIVQLSPLLSASGTGMLPLYYNVTRDVQWIQLQQGCPQNLMDAPAVHPSCPLLVLSVPSLPWHTIEVRNPIGVTVRDVLVRIRDVLNRSVAAAEMGSLGVKRIDFLGPNVMFAGLSRTMDGRDRWEVRFVPGA